ncbi:acyl-CoA dehydrogenase [Salinisphaera sp. PC39]
MAHAATSTAPGSYMLPPRQAEIRGQAETLAAHFAERQREIRRHPFEHGELHPELWAEIRERGWPGLLVPPDQGGCDGGLWGMALVLETLAASNLVLWMPVLTAAIGHAIAQVGPDTARERWLERIAAGETLLALAATEPECGHNLFRVQTTVRPAGDGFVVDGVKAVTSGIDLAERVLVFGRTPGEKEGDKAGFTAVLIDPEAAGVGYEELPMRGREGVRQFRLTLDGVRAPAEDLVGGTGGGLQVLWPFTHVERLLTAALCLGTARYCLSRALARAKERTIFGKTPIGAEQAIQHPLARLSARLDAAQLLVYKAAADFDAGGDLLTIAGAANKAKVLASDLVYDAADHVVQTLGAPAWDEREGILDVFLDARLSRAGPVSQELALNFIAQHVLGLPSHR